MFSHNGMTPMEARRRMMMKSKPGEAKPSGGMTKPHDQEEHGEDHNGSDNAGDGMHHHEMQGPDDAGMWTSKHTHPDGKVEHADHMSYDDAKDHMDRMHGETEDDNEHDDHSSMSEDEPDGDEPEDLASMYDNG
jgi:hypothetical protein